MVVGLGIGRSGGANEAHLMVRDANFLGTGRYLSLARDSNVDRSQTELSFVDDHLLGNPRFARALFDGMRGMGRVFQGASTVDAILRSDLIEHAAAAGMRSVFVGLETINEENLRLHAKRESVLAEMKRRLHNDRSTELANAMEQIGHITRARLEKIVDG